MKISLDSFTISIICLALLLTANQANSQTLVVNLKSEPRLELRFADGLPNETLKNKLTVELTLMMRAQRENNLSYTHVDTLSSLIRVDQKFLLLKLKSLGYHRAQISANDPNSLDALTYKILLGQRYIIQKVELDGPNFISNYYDNLQSKAGQPLLASIVLTDVSQLKEHLKLNYCLYEIKVTYEAVLDHQTNTASLRFLVKDSPPVRFGNVIIKGNTQISEQFIRDRISLNRGDCFKRTKIARARSRLLQTGLFSHVRFDVESPNQGFVDLHLRVFERPHRTRKVGVGFESDEGLSLNLGWTHRSLGAQAQHFTAQSEFRDNEQEIKLDLSLPYYPDNTKSLSLYAEAGLEQTDAFHTKKGLFGIMLSNQITTEMTTRIGFEISQTHLDQVTRERRITLLSTPLHIEINHRNDLLNPESGWAVNSSLHPYIDIDKDNEFIKIVLSGFFYKTWIRQQLKTTLAIRAKLGALFGGSLQNIPENDRFYAGGGGSIRGYDYQKAGELIDSKPTGGLSIFETATEVRLRWSTHWSSVVFVDAGSSFLSKTPQVHETLFWSVGVGMRYHTQFFPIRFDIASPLNRRKTIDSPIGIYISIGQAF